MSGAGWVKLHRKFCEWEWFDDPNTLKLFIYLMTHVNFERKNWHGVEVLPGQMITGRQKLAVAAGLSEQSIRTSIKRLKSTSDLTIKVTNKYSVITLTNWAKYQSIDTELTSKVTGNLTNNQPATNQQLTTTNKGNKGNKDKNVRTHKHKGFQKPTTKQVSDYCKERNNDVDAQTFIDHYESNGWKVGRNSMKDWRAAVRTWERNEYGGQSLKEGNKIKIINPKKPS